LLSPSRADRRNSLANVTQLNASVVIPEFALSCGTLGSELRKQRDTSKNVILVPLFDLTFLNERAADDAGTSNRRHYAMSYQNAIG
jgi:hypothetical protein